MSDWWRPRERGRPALANERKALSIPGSPGTGNEGDRKSDVHPCEGGGSEPGRVTPSNIPRTGIRPVVVQGIAQGTSARRSGRWP